MIDQYHRNILNCRIDYTSTYTLICMNFIHNLCIHVILNTAKR